MRLLRQFPSFVLLLMAGALLMLLPALHAAQLRQWPVARTFLEQSVFFVLVGIILGLATMNRPVRIPSRYFLMTLLLAYVLLPLVLAAPLASLVPGIGLGGAYFEMLSCLTTTGATLFDRPQVLSEPLHLWRALIGWAGGLLTLVASFAILAPLNLGGFEIGHAGDDRRGVVRSGTLAEGRHRLARALRIIAPVYGGMTLALFMILVLCGDTAFVALCHAMGTLSTSGISPVGGLSGSRAGLPGEIAIAFFLLPAVSLRGFGVLSRRRIGPRFSDPQIQLMLISVLGITVVLFLRSFVGAAEIDRQDHLLTALRAIWGSLFTVLSFLTTTGYESHDWRTMQLWSYLPDPGIVLLGVAVMGGGVATTAGGIKLLRLYALYRHGLRELDRLIHPNALGRRGRGEKLISSRGARVAFIFLMLFLIATAVAMYALALTGVGFVRSLGVAISGLTTTGQAMPVLGDAGVYRELTTTGRAVFCAAMIVGRMEVLVILALFNPVYWRQ
jgi:trk system potassium uptake protein TrkH